MAPTPHRSIRRAVLAAAALLAACAAEPETEQDFHTSGSREADQRAEQRVNKVQQLRGEEAPEPGERTRPLYERLGGADGVRRIVDDFVDRVILDPRVNWTRKGVTSGGVLGIGSESREWHASPDQVTRLKEHLAQFLALAAGGPTVYEGRTLSEVHAGMKITNSQFDATVGAMQATLDMLGVGIEEQKELLALLESTRPQISEER